MLLFRLLSLTHVSRLTMFSMIFQWSQHTRAHPSQCVASLSADECLPSCTGRHDCFQPGSDCGCMPGCGRVCYIPDEYCSSIGLMDDHAQCSEPTCQVDSDCSPGRHCVCDQGCGRVCAKLGLPELCPLLKPFENVIIHYQASAVFGSAAFHRCSVGTLLRGPHVKTCRASGQWYPEDQVYCEPADESHITEMRLDNNDLQRQSSVHSSDYLFVPVQVSTETYVHQEQPTEFTQTGFHRYDSEEANSYVRNLPVESAGIYVVEVSQQHEPSWWEDDRIEQTETSTHRADRTEVIRNMNLYPGAYPNAFIGAIDTGTTASESTLMLSHTELSELHDALSFGDHQCGDHERYSADDNPSTHTANTSYQPTETHQAMQHTPHPSWYAHDFTTSSLPELAAFTSSSSSFSCDGIPNKCQQIAYDKPVRWLENADVDEANNIRSRCTSDEWKAMEACQSPCERHTLRVSSDVLCKSEDWCNQIPYCKASRNCTIDYIPHEIVDTGGLTSPFYLRSNEMRLFKCRYKPMNITLECKDGQLIGNFSECEKASPVVCKVPVEVYRQRFHVDAKTVIGQPGAVIEGKCRVGGVKFVVHCSESGQVLHNSSACPTPRGCSLPMSMLYSVKLYSVEVDRRKKVMDDGEGLVYGCRADNGTISEFRIATCVDGTWIPPPICTVGFCSSKPPVVRNARSFVLAGMTPDCNFGRAGCVSSSVIYKCYPGYIMHDKRAETVRCENDMWLPPYPVCTRSKCKKPRIPSNADISLVVDDVTYKFDKIRYQYGHGDTVMYSCGKRFYLVGHVYVTCVDGEWSPKPNAECVSGKPMNVLATRVNLQGKINTAKRFPVPIPT